MKIIPWIVSYNGMGTGPSVKACVDFLMPKPSANLGAAITQVEIFAHCRSREQTLPTLGSMRDRFNKRILTLPKIWFRRKTRLFEVAYLSQLEHFDDMFKPGLRLLDLNYFRTFCREFAEALLMIEKRVKAADGFDMPALRVLLRDRLGSLPANEDELRHWHVGQPSPNPAGEA